MAQDGGSRGWAVVEGLQVKGVLEEDRDGVVEVSG